MESKETTPKDRGNESDTGVSTIQDDNLARITSNAIEIVNGEPIFKPNRDFYLAFLALCVVTLTIALDATSLSVALPIVSTALGGTALEAFWSGTSFLLSSTVFQPSIASLSDIFGRKNVSISSGGGEGGVECELTIV
jgi:hypothetical protein